MNKLQVIICVLLFLTTTSYGQEKPKTILWKVTKPGSNHVSFLFGTFHEVSPSFFDSLPTAVSGLLQSDALFVETRTVGIRKWPDLGKQPKWNQKQWSELLTSGQKQLFAAFVSKAEDSSYYQLNPLLLLLTTSRLYLTNFCDLTPSSQELMDSHIERTAVNHNKPVYALDPDQSRILRKTANSLTADQDSLYASYSIRFMKSMLENDLTDCEIINTYKSFNLNYELDVDISLSSVHALLLTERNKTWTKQLQQEFALRNCFVAVGYKHLFYKQGLIQELRRLGYSVTPVNIVR
jgi:uncharacterized protein YbaP (TraB family)